MHLESAVQHYAEHEPLYVATGVVFEPVGQSHEIVYTSAKDDTKRVPVPNYFYKVVLRVERDSSGEVVDAEAIGFWFEHRAYSDKYYNYAMSVDEVERLTGFDFFASLPDDVEARAERNTKNFLR
jgi:endonuclease G